MWGKCLMSLADGINRQMKRLVFERHNTITEHLAITTNTIGKRCNVNCDMPKKTYRLIGRNVFKPYNVTTWHMLKTCASSEAKCPKQKTDQTSRKSGHTTCYFSLASQCSSHPCFQLNLIIVMLKCALQMDNLLTYYEVCQGDCHFYYHQNY